MPHRFCRLCEDVDDERRLVQYAARSYVHWLCKLRRMTLEDGLAWIRSLPAHVIRTAPVLIVQDWLDARGWAGKRALEILLDAVQAADLREAR